MVAETTPPSEGAEAAGTPAAPAIRTAEEVEAEWANRMSQRDRAHNAEMEALRRQVADRDAADQRRREADDAARRASMSETEVAQDQIKSLTQQLEAERIGRAIDARKGRFPNAAEVLGDTALAAADEAKLAALESRLTAGQAAPSQPPSLIDPNSSARLPSGQSLDPRDKTVEELKADLQQYSPEFIQRVEEVRGRR